MQPNLVIHVGFSKTGTTTQQTHLFSQHSQIDYLGKPHNDIVQKNIIEMVRQETTLYNPAPFKDYIKSILKSRDDNSKKVILLSNEVILSRGKSIDKGVVAERVKEIFYPCRIMFTVRNQFEILKSAYLSSDRLLQNVPKRYWGLAVDFNQWLEHSFKLYHDMDRNYISHADYFKTIQKYTQLFGKENVGVFVLEEFINHQNQYIDKLSRFLNIDAKEALERVKHKHEHKEITQTQLNFELLNAKLFPFSRFRGFSTLLQFYYGVKRKVSNENAAQVTFSDHYREKLIEIFKPGNQKLIDTFDLPLAPYNYPL